MRGIAILVLMSVVAFADESPVTALPPGARLAITFDHSIKAGQQRPGETVSATLVSPVVSHGVILIPKSAKILGHVLVSDARAKNDYSHLIIRFEQARWNGGSVDLNAHIVRQIVAKRVVTNGIGRSDCAPVQRTPPLNRAALDQNRDPLTRERIVPPVPEDLKPLTCSAAQSAVTTTHDQVVFYSPPLKNMQLRWSSNFTNVTELISREKTIQLKRNIILEIQNVH